MDKPAEFTKLDCNRCGAPYWSRQHECPATGKKCAICEKVSSYAKCCRTDKRVNRIREHETSSAEEDDWTIQSEHNPFRKQEDPFNTPNEKGRPEFFTLTALVNYRPIKFIIDSGSPLTLVSNSQYNRMTALKLLETDYRIVYDNRIRFEGKTRLGMDGEIGNNAGYR